MNFYNVFAFFLVLFERLEFFFAHVVEYFSFHIEGIYVL